MSKMGRPPRLYTVTTHDLADGRIVSDTPYVGLYQLSIGIGISEPLVCRMLAALGGEFQRKRELEDGSVLVDHVRRVG